MQTCTKCNNKKPLIEFSTDPRKKSGRRSHCRTCCAASAIARYQTDPNKYIKQATAWKKNNRARINKTTKVWRQAGFGSLSEMLSQAKKRAKTVGVPFTLTAADISIPKFCPVFCKPLIRASTKGPSPWSPSLDKIIPSLGYVPGNVRVLSHKANLMKNDATPEELRAFADWINTTLAP